ncbi:MAG: hypothetical protein EHM36_12110 [Deltaproteobacteria bacterium]|nr:MAG: hypothetical protein EHM36_12110 [Deltaproteobacteria bacterium]
MGKPARRLCVACLVGKPVEEFGGSRYTRCVQCRKEKRLAKCDKKISRLYRHVLRCNNFPDCNGEIVVYMDCPTLPRGFRKYCQVCHEKGRPDWRSFTYESRKEYEE